MIIRGGENIYPAELEQFLHTHPKIEEVQVSRTDRCGGGRIIGMLPSRTFVMGLFVYIHAQLFTQLEISYTGEG